jgi:hypothetical protein
MARNTRELQCTSEDVFGVLADGWVYPSWVVGASRMRDVDEGWPAQHGSLHHSFGVWPLLIDDTTVVTEWSPPRRMRMRARGWPIGEARVVIDVQDRAGELRRPDRGGARQRAGTRHPPVDLRPAHPMAKRGNPPPARLPRRGESAQRRASVGEGSRWFSRRTDCRPASRSHPSCRGSQALRPTRCLLRRRRRAFRGCSAGASPCRS